MARKRRPLTRDQVDAALRKWQRKLLLDGWDIKLQYGPNTEDEDRAGLYALPEYREATVFWDPQRVEVYTVRKAEEWCCHELVHGILWPLEKLAEHWAGEDASKFEVARDTAEGVATNIEKAMLHIDRRGR